MNGNVKAFFEKYDNDPELRERLLKDEQLYPGSLEIREAVAEYVLLPVAAEMGLGFTLEELREYEEAVWNERHSDEVADEDDEAIDDTGDKYWLLGRGWSNDEARFCGDPPKKNK